MKSKINAQLKQLDSFGFSHDFIIVIFIVIFAIIGVGYLVLSHASPVTVPSPPSIAVNPSNQQQFVFYKGTDGNLWTVDNVNGWQTPLRLAVSLVVPSQDRSARSKSH